MRLDMARQNFAELKAACDRFVRDDPDTAAGVNVEIDPDAGRVVATAHIPKDFPESLGGLAGQILYNLRAALENLAWQLVEANGETPGEHTGFPVFKDEPKFKGGARGQTKGMSKSARATIKRLQPFNEWPEHPEHATLWKIHELAKVDRHRIPHMTSIELARCKGSLELDRPGDIGAELLFLAEPGPIEDSAELFRIGYDPARAVVLDCKMQVQFDLAIDPVLTHPHVTFLSPGGEPREGAPLHHLFGVALSYVATTLLPAFDGEL